MRYTTLMIEGIFSILSFLETYLIPIVFAVGVIFFIYGFIVYFILGAPSGDTDAIDRGRQHVLRACVFFFAALLAQGVVVGLYWLMTELSTAFETETRTDEQGETRAPGVEVETGEDILRVPNVPRR